MDSGILYPASWRNDDTIDSVKPKLLMIVLCMPIQPNIIIILLSYLLLYRIQKSFWKN